MTKLKIGDRVRYARHGNIWTCVKVGDICTIVSIRGEIADVSTADGRIQGVELDTLEPVTFSVGQIYRIEKSIHNKDLDGSIFKISGENHEIPYRFTTKPIRGKSPDYFDEGSYFAKAITLLTGKEIGEAIRKWDADHAKKPEPKYNEVKRIAKKGEYVKIVNAHDTHGNYTNGSILKIVGDSEGMVGPRYGIGCGEFLDCEEYVVLEGYKPEQKAPVKAKVGDTIQITKDCGGPATPGKSGKVVSVSEDCAFVQLSPHIGPMFIPYEIEHGSYKILSSGKRFDFEKAKMLGRRSADCFVIHCNNPGETHALGKILDGLGYRWGNGELLTEKFYANNANYCIYDTKEVRWDAGKDSCSVEFSDCFTGD